MEKLFKEVKLEELENQKGSGLGKAQCAALWLQCASGGTIGCGGGAVACQNYQIGRAHV